MSSPYHDVNRRAADALRANPTAVAGLAGFDDGPDDLATALAGLARCVRTEIWHRHGDAGATLFAMIKVAQQNYGGEDRGYWPHLAERLGLGGLAQPDQTRLGEWFRDGLEQFGYPSDVPGHLTNLSPVLWHAGWSRPHLRPLVDFVAGQVEVYGERAAEPDAPHALRLGRVAKGWTPPLPRTIVRLLGGGAAGVGELWARLAGAVLARKRGAASVRASWEPLGGITAEDILAAMPMRHLGGLSAASCPRRPRLRYHADTGEIRLWLVDGNASEWRVDGLRLAWQGDSAEVLPPLPARFALTHVPTQASWTEVLFAGSRPAVWFGRRSGVLERGDEVASRGVSTGEHHLVCRGVPDGLPPEARCPLHLGYYAGGEGWAAWEVDVPDRQGSGGPAAYTIRVDGEEWRFPVARGSAPIVRVDGDAVGEGELPDGARVALFPGPPKVELRSGTAVRLLRRIEGAAEPLGEWTAGGGTEAVRDCGPGVYQLREARGVGRVLLDYAVLPGLGAPVVEVAGDTARLFVPVASGGRAEGGTAVPGGWAVEGPASEPWRTATWRWDTGCWLPVTLRAAVRTVRWRIADPKGPTSDWNRTTISVCRREASARRLRLEIEVPVFEGLLVNESPPVVEPAAGPTGWRLTLPLDAYPAADAIRVRAEGEEFVPAWLSERPVLRSFEAILDDGMVAACWEPEHVPASSTIGMWDPTDPGGHVTTLTVSPEQVLNHGGEWPLPPALAGADHLAVSLGSKGQGFGARPFQPATSPAGEPLAALATQAGDPPGGWAKVAHGWTLRHRWGQGQHAPIGTELQALAANPPWAEMLAYVARLPAACPLRQSLAELLSLAGGPVAARRVAVASDPIAEMRGWLAIGIHPFWAGTADVRPKSDDCGYPAGYLWDLSVLDDTGKDVELKRAAADAVVQEHADRDLFPPLRGLPLEAAEIQGLPLVLEGQARDGKPHRHRLNKVVLSALDSTADSLVAMVCGHDAYLSAAAAGGDTFPSTTARQSAGSGGVRTAVRAVHYVETRYDLGWCDEGHWQVGRQQWDPDRGRMRYKPCCELARPPAVAPWRPAELAERLGLVKWLLRHSAGVPAPVIALPGEFDAPLYAGPVSVVHRRVLEPPPMVDGRLDDLKFNVTGGGLGIRTPAYQDVPPAGKLAWRLAWLDRLPPTDRTAVADWSPFHAALAAALAQGPQFVRLLSGCIVIAEYVRRVLSGGIGPVMRFSPTEVSRP